MRLFLGITPTTWINRTRSRWGKLNYILIEQPLSRSSKIMVGGGELNLIAFKKLQFLENFEHGLCEIWVQPPVLKLDSSKQRDTSKTTSPETLLQELYSYAWLSWSQIPNCYQQLSWGFAVLLNHPLDSSSTPSGSISEPRLRLSSALHTTAIPPPACLDAKQKTKPTGSPC